MKIYTGTGDDGITTNLRGLRIPKDSFEIKLLGTMDELTSSIGFAKSLTNDGELKDHLEWIQHEIEAFNSEISGGSELNLSIPMLESMIDSYQQYISPFKGFVKPGESKLSAALDISRTVARRAEREIFEAINGKHFVATKEHGIYLNRLSDLLYVMARFAGAMDKLRLQVIEQVNSLKAENSDITLTEYNSIDLKSAKALCEKIEQEALKIGIKVVISICDASGNLILLHKMDDAYIASIDIAINKAFTSVALKMTTAMVGELSKQGSSLHGLELTNNSRLVTFGGGIPLKLKGKIIGGLGISGGSAEQDTKLAEIGASLVEKA